jgi:toxin FitB
MKSASVLLDSSAWIEIFGQGPLLQACQKELRSASVVCVPTIVLFEVYRKIAQQVSEDSALSAIAVLTQNSVEDLTQEIALSGADLSLTHQLPMADSLILAHALRSGSTLVTLDNDFSSIPGVKVIRA